MAERQTVAGAYQKIQAHEDICAERYGNIHSTLSDLKDGQKSHGRAAWGIAIALVAWMAAQLWAMQDKRTERLEQAKSVVAAPSR